MSANTVTLARLPLLVLIIGLLYRPAFAPQQLAAFLIIALIAMDSFDGWWARRRGESSVLGSVLDIAMDRLVEFVLWVVFADLDMIPIIIPLVVLSRGVVVDAVRSVAPAKGLRPFDIVQSDLGRFLVSSPWMRTSFALAKVAAFFLLGLALSLQTGGHAAALTIRLIASGAAWLALGFCLARGLPVLIEAPQALR
ncbi:MAG: CDP-alcohol phosphatidyltransferase family protein [Anaerolineales bacterium]